MNDLERRLRSLSEIEPSADLDQRIATTCDDAARRVRRRATRRLIPLPLALAACAGCLILGFVIRPVVDPSIPEAPSSPIVDVPMSPTLERSLIRHDDVDTRDFVRLSFCDSVATSGTATGRPAKRTEGTDNDS